MNTEEGSPPSKPPDFSKLQGDTPSGQTSEKDQALVSLESQLQAERDARMEERFVWLVIVIILLDVIWFRNATNSTAPIVVMVLELVVLLVLARRMQVDEYVQVISNLLHVMGKKGGN